MRVYLTSLGCKLNQSEVESWARRLVGAGHTIVASPDTADLCIINTCTVTHVAARKSHQIIRRCNRANPLAQIAVTGCEAEMNPNEIRELPGVSLVLGTDAKERLLETIAEQVGLSLQCQIISPHHRSFGHTRAFVKIQDGCDNACTYCVVRIARGKQRSRPLADILGEIIARQEEGYQEIVLTGVHIGAYGREQGETLAGLIRAILANTDFPRLRLSSIEPWDLTPELLHLWENPRMCRHLHMPLQSGCDATLQRMNRRYTTAQYRDLLSSARDWIPNLAVTTDIIVGFPGEDEQEFATSAAFVAAMKFARIHVFPFSARPGTAAASMSGQVNPSIKKKRSNLMLGIARYSAEAFHHQFIGRTMDVLWEHAIGDRWSGLTDNYIRVEVTSDLHLHNRILPVRLLELSNMGLRGELLQEMDVGPCLLQR
nr:tRNA (N(6)-L-threonylcarbamoyladenosine(37)-C(2))-methylthiotransferase MtaB [Chloroflexota bacterium]